MIGLDQLLNIALRIESKGYSYYTALSEKAKGETAKVLEKLAGDERRHAERFKEIFSKATERETRSGWPSEDVMGYLTTYAEISIFPKLEKGVPDELNDALELALDVEKESVLFYQDVAEYLKSPLLDEIIAEEKKHLRTILGLMKGG